MPLKDASSEKQNAAFLSVLAAVGLTAIKIVIGLLTNSLGILAEAAHSALDLVAALMTLIAVRFSDRPADSQHNYGYGKIENLSALFETLLLLVTSAWIIYEAIQRLFFETQKVTPSIWSFIVMGTSIVVDINRSRMLYRTAEKYKSQALEADALHFKTDIWSSSVVIFGLVGLTIAELIPQVGWLVSADSIAALVVAVLVIIVSLRLGIRTVSALIDTAPITLADQIKNMVNEIPGVFDAHHIRIRPSGANTFVDMHIRINAQCNVVEAHRLTEIIEEKVSSIISPADITVHVEPPRAELDI